MVCCNSCQNDNAAKICTVCRAVTYCNADCQKSDWASHKSVCTAKATRDLIDAVRASDEDTVRRLAKTPRVLNGRVDYDTGSEDEHRTVLGKWTALHECVRSSDTTMMKILIEHNAKVDIKDVDGETPTFVAATVYDPEVIRVLLEAGGNPNATAKDGWSCIMMAVRDGNYGAVKYLLEAGADLMAGQDMFGRTALDLAKQMQSGQGRMHRKNEPEEEAQDRYNKQAIILQEYVTSRGRNN